MILNNEDGTIRYGAYNLPVYKFPLKEKDNIDLGYSISFILNEPKPQIKTDPEPEINLNPVPEEPRKKTPSDRPMPTQENSKHTEPEEEEKLPPPKPETPPQPKENSNEAFISNTLKQYNEVQFDTKEIIVLYIDSCRYLPENVTVSHMTMKGIISTGDVVIDTLTLKPHIDASTAFKPYFGVRNEITKEKHPKMNSSTILVFKIDAIEREKFRQVTVGYAFFPLFVDITTGKAAKDKVPEYSLQNGYYQIPIYSQKPVFTKPIEYEKLTDLLRIP